MASVLSIEHSRQSSSARETVTAAQDIPIERIIPLTEKILLNRWVLAWICPSNCEMQAVKSVQNSVLQSFLEMRERPYSNPSKNSYWHWAFKPVRAVARAVTVLGTTCFLSPVGALCYGSITTVKLISYVFNRVMYGNDVPRDAEWNRIKEYAKAFFTDLSCFLLGALVGTTVWMFGQAIVMAETPIDMFVSILLLSSQFYLCGGFTYEEMIPQWLGWEKERAGMYLSLYLRNHFGLGDSQGNLLPFGSEDQVCTLGRELRINWSANGTKLTECMIYAEIDLIEILGKANKYLGSEGKGSIQFDWPFPQKKRQEVLQRLENVVSRSNDLAQNAEGRELISRLRFLSEKVEHLQKLVHQGAELSVNPSLLAQVFKAPTYSITIPSLPLEEAKMFFAGIASSRSFDLPLNEVLESSILAFNSTHNAPNELYNKFVQKIRENQQRLTREEPIEPVETFLGLDEGCSVAEYHSAHRKYSLAIYPDKQTPDLREEATELFKILGALKERFDKKRDSQSQRAAV